MNNKLTYINYVALVFAVVFTLLQIHFKVDISVFALIFSSVFTGALAFVSLVLVQKNVSVSGVRAMSKMYEYAPFVYLIVFVLRRAGKQGTLYGYDVITVLLWLVILICVFIIRYQLNEKRFFNLNPLFATKKANINPKKMVVGLRVVKEVIGWIDALVWAVFAVALIEVFVFQLYEIPSESMVPEFLVKDRVAVLKISDGPKFPLSDVGLPRFRNYDRGDIVVFSNPHYDQNRQAQVQKFTAQLVYMFTLMQVNLNVDEDGNLKADPLVKRVCGVPGDQLVMVDGVLYNHTKDSNKFTLVKDDSLWAEWNLDGLPNSTKSKVLDVRFTQTEYQQMLDFEEMRRNLNIADTATESKDIAIEFSKLKKILSGSSDENQEVPDLFVGSDLYIYDFFNSFDAITRKMLSVDGGDTWFAAFMTNWIATTDNEDLIGGDVYSDAMFRMNLLAKRTFGRIVVTYSKAIANGESVSELYKDSDFLGDLEIAQMVVKYMSRINDLRNMPVFPANTEDGKAQYIPSHSYFMMGDNRFNSLDMRHSYEYKLVAITNNDTYSLRYNSNMAPQYVPDSQILGTTLLRIFPFSRFGIPGSTAEKS